MEKRISEASLISDSTSSINVLSSEFDTLSTQAKAVILIALFDFCFNFHRRNCLKIIVEQY